METVEVEGQKIQFDRMLGTEFETFTTQSGKKLTLRSPKLKLATEFQKKFGANRLFMNPAGPDGRVKELTYEEVKWLLFRMTDEKPWQNEEQMEDELTMAEMGKLTELIHSFFYGVKIGKITSSDSSSSESLS